MQTRGIRAEKPAGESPGFSRGRSQIERNRIPADRVGIASLGEDLAQRLPSANASS